MKNQERVHEYPEPHPTTLEKKGTERIKRKITKRIKGEERRERRHTRNRLGPAYIEAHETQQNKEACIGRRGAIEYSFCSTHRSHHRDLYKLYEYKRYCIALDTSVL